MKRIFDIVLSAVVFVLLLPIFIVIAVFIKAGSKGPVFYLQTRVGKDESDFKIFKFRTMYIGSDKNGLLTVGGNDSRITKTGRFLRNYKLDEFPQLINVLIGDMSLVGPRPEVRKYVNLYNKEQLKVLSVKPGITDYASVEYSLENELLSKAQDPEKEYIEVIMPAKLLLNLKYINERSFFVDLKILWSTVAKIATSH